VFLATMDIRAHAINAHRSDRSGGNVAGLTMAARRGEVLVFFSRLQFC
jgi:hypothetical protein